LAINDKSVRSTTHTNGKLAATQLGAQTDPRPLAGVGFPAYPLESHD
jgi:hypothetical protein